MTEGFPTRRTVPAGGQRWPFRPSCRSIQLVRNPPAPERDWSSRPAKKSPPLASGRGSPSMSATTQIGATTWAQFILKFILSHPAITVVIPATTRVDHVRENVAAAAGPMPDDLMRKRMAAYVEEL